MSFVLWKIKKGLYDMKWNRISFSLFEMWNKIIFELFKVYVIWNEIK